MIAVFRACGAWITGAAAVPLLLLTGCAGVPQTHALLQRPPEGLGRAAELTAVPFYPQERFQCGPAALATVLGWGGVDVSPDELAPRVYLPARRGSLQPELLAAARHYRRVPYRLAPTLDDLLHEIQAGHPVLVLQNLAYTWYPRWHYAVVVGYDLDRGELILRSGTLARQALPMRTFEWTWRRAEYWAVVILEANELPATAAEADYLRAVLPFEQAADWQTAAVAYRAATSRWPGSFTAWFGLGNSAFQLQDRDAAEMALRRALTLQPDQPAVLNNLAYVLLMQGRLQEADAAAEQAVALDPTNTEYADTLEEIRHTRSAARAEP